MALNSKQLFITKFNPPHFNSLNPKRLSPPITFCHLTTTNNINNFKLSIKPRQNLNYNVLSPHKHKFIRQPTKAHTFDTEPGFLGPDNSLNAAESICLISSVIVTAFFTVKYLVLGAKKWVFAELDYRVLFFGIAMHVCGTVIGVWVRRRRNVGFEKSGQLREPVGLVERVEEMEGGLRDVVKVNRMLAKQLEKLGVRFRVTRRSLKDPIDETAALAQKNLESQRALEMQISILEKEIGESQKAMLAMQEQQYKQLELIMAMGKVLKLLDGEQGQDANKTRDSAGGDLGSR